MDKFHVYNPARRLLLQTMNISTKRYHSIQFKCTLSSPLSRFELHGYRPSAALSDDVNYMDIVMIITRSSMLRQGSMGCLLVNPTCTNNSHIQQSDLLGRIIAAATNTSLLKPDDSDVHAEINAIGQVAKHAHLSTQGATAYITMPPCKRCFGALFSAGIKRIVSRRPPDIQLKAAASNVGIEMACLTKEEATDQQKRLDQLFANINGSEDSERNVGEENSEEISRRRLQRKEEKRARKMAKIAQDKNMKGNGDR